MRPIDADEMLKRAETWNTEDWMDKALYNFMRARIIEQPTVDIDAITESHERTGYDRGFRDGYAEALKETDNVPDKNVGKRLIDADAFFNDFPELKNYEYASQEYEVDAEPVKHGHWITWFENEDVRQAKCSECGMMFTLGKGRDIHYCGNCGAYMGETK